MLAVGIVVVFTLAFAAVVYLALGGAGVSAQAGGADRILPASAEPADGQDASFRSYQDELTKLEFAYLPHNEHHHLVSPEVQI